MPEADVSVVPFDRAHLSGVLALFAAEGWSYADDAERTWRALPGTKADAIRARFGLSDSRYYQLLNDVLDEPGVAAYDPLVVKRLRRHRERRRRARFDRQYGGSESR